MRRASEKSLDDLSARLKTPAQTIEALEAGAISALPDWTETSRVVTEYAGLLGLDSRPVLRRLKARREEAAAQPQPRTPPEAKPAEPRPLAGAVTGMPPAPSAQPPQTSGPPLPPGANPPLAEPGPAPAEKPEGPPDADMTAGKPAPAPEPIPVEPEAPPRSAPKRDLPRRRWFSVGALTTWLLLLVLFGAMGLGVRYAVQHPQLVWSTVDRLPDPAPRILRSVWELLRPLESQSQDQSAGADPRSQKSDKLPAGE
jgi:hypothetical protein